jgi:hypothetical protein
MAGVLVGKTFTQEYMPEVGAAIAARNFSTHSVGGTGYGPGKFVVETRPAATRIEFIGRMVQPGATPFANIRPSFPKFIVFARKRNFSTFVHNYPFFFRR